MTQDKIVVEAEVDEVGDLFDDGSMGPDGAGIALRTQRGEAVRRGQILTGREALIAARWLRPYHRVRVTIEPIAEDPEKRMSAERVKHLATVVRTQLGRLGCQELAAMLNIRGGDAAELRELLLQECVR